MYDPQKAADIIRAGIATDMPEKDRVLANALVDIMLGLILNVQRMADVAEARARHESIPGYHL
jgi:hypothetical protein